MATCPQCGTEYPATVRICTKDGTVLEDTRPTPVADPMVGVVLDGKYRLDGKLSHGGMGTVYRATHLMLNKVVAVKLINADLVTSPEVVKRFQREARAASALNHPNIAPAYDLGQTGDGTLYIAMELVKGSNLKEVIRSTGQMDTGRIVRILRQVASALSMAHKHDIIHRDLKPHNIIIGKDDRGQDLPKLLDFGIAKTFDESSTQLTATGFALGTPQYMSPEQATGKIVDGRSDIYALGIILYEMLIGEVPFNDPSTPAVLVKQLMEAPEPPSRKRPDLTISPTLEAIALRCLEKDPDLRFQTVDELSDALESATGAHESAGIASQDNLATVILPGMSSATRTAVSAGQTPTATRAATPPTASSYASSPGATPPLTMPTAPPLAVAPTRPASPSPIPAAPPRPVSAPPGASTAPPAIQKSGMSGAVIGIAAVLLLVLLGGGAAYGLGFIKWPGSSDQPITLAPTPTPTSEGAAAGASNAPPINSGSGAPPAGSSTGSGTGSAGTSSPIAAGPGAVPPAGAGAGTPTPAPPPAGGSTAAKPATPTPTPTPTATAEKEQPAAPPLPVNPSVAFRCDGNGPDVCSALRTAMNEALEKDSMTSVRDPNRAEVIIDARVTFVDEKTQNMFGTTMITRTYAIEFSGESRRTGADIGMPSTPNVSFDSGVGKGKLDAAARVATMDVVEKIRAAWKKKD